MKVTKVNNQGFTLVELLIVIVIIGILALIGFVSFSGAQNKAHKADAQSTLSTIKSKLGEYQSDNDSYPSTKAQINTYLTANHNNDMAATFSTSEYGYTATPSGCDGTKAAACTDYTLTADATNWGGAHPADDLSVQN